MLIDSIGRLRRIEAERSLINFSDIMKGVRARSLATRESRVHRRIPTTKEEEERRSSRRFNQTRNADRRGISDMQIRAYRTIDKEKGGAAARMTCTGRTVVTICEGHNSGWSVSPFIVFQTVACDRGG